MVKDRDIVAGLFLVAFAIVVLIIIGQLPEPIGNELGAGFFPRICALAVGACGMGLAVQGWKRTDKQKLPVFAWNKLITMAIILAAYAMALRFLGFVISTILFVIVCMLFMGERKPITLVLVPLSVAFGIYFLFEKVFLILLP
jgi:putative tricarboxylic transport membrane protein